MAFRLKLAKPLLAAKNVPINEKRPRGRPKVATKALSRYCDFVFKIFFHFL